MKQQRDEKERQLESLRQTILKLEEKEAELERQKKEALTSVFSQEVEARHKALMDEHSLTTYTVCLVGFVMGMVLALVQAH